MKKEAINYLKKIVEIPSPSGYEHYAQLEFKAAANKLGLPVSEDVLGNVVAHLAYPGKPKLLLSAHIDEVGFVVKHIDDSGYLYIVPVGGVDKMLLPGSRVVITHRKRHYLGICGRKPIHLLSEQERNKFDWENLWIDCGFTSRNHALEHIAIGAPVVFNSDFAEMTETLIATRAADNKVGNALLVELMLRLASSKSDLKYDTYFASTVQEEIGLRGSMVTAANIKPEICLVIDAAHATDYSSANPKTQGEIKMEHGPVIAFSPDTDPRLVNRIIDIAEAKNLPYQRDVYPNASGTEAKAMQIQCGGISTATVSYPVRYMHSPSEIFSLKDADTLAEIIEQFVLQA